MNKKSIVLIGLSVFSTAIFAQEVSQIELPDVTTVVNADSLKAEKDALPDFSDVLEVSSDSGAVTVQLPDVDGKNQTVDVVSEGSKNEKTVYAEGQFGAGYPHFFSGDFAVYSIALNNPFDLRFSHKTAAGFAGQELSNGYSDKETSVKLKKQLELKNTVFSFYGDYNSINLGLQNKSSDLSGINNDKISTEDSVKWNLPKGFGLGLGVNSSLYNRYADTCISKDSLPVWIASARNFEVTPEVFASWNGHGFNVDLKGNFFLGFSKLNEEKVSNRGDVGLGLSWGNKIIKIYGTSDVTFGNLTGEKKALFPFTVGFNTNIPVSFANRNIALQLSGGLDSYRNAIYNLEEKYHYTALNFVPYDSSDWYGKFKVEFPIKTSFSSSVSMDFRKTAFDNGTYLPVYSDDIYGLYGFERKNQTYVTSDINLSYHYKIVSITGGYKTNWLDVPVLETSNQLNVEVTVQSELSKWGATAACNIGLGTGAQAPVLNLNGFVKISNAARLILSAEDVFKLVSGSLRTYGGQYYSTSGTAAVMLKFNF